MACFLWELLNAEGQPLRLSFSVLYAHGTGEDRVENSFSHTFRIEDYQVCLCACMCEWLFKHVRHLYEWLLKRDWRQALNQHRLNAHHTPAVVAEWLWQPAPRSQAWFLAATAAFQWRQIAKTFTRLAFDASWKSQAYKSNSLLCSHNSCAVETLGSNKLVINLECQITLLGTLQYLFHAKRWLSWRRNCE